MCLFPSSILNKRYGARSNAHPALKYVTAKCGVCIECRQQRAREWQQRLHEEVRGGKYKNPKFITLTVDNETAAKYGIDYEGKQPKGSEEKKKLYEKEHTMMKDLVRKWRLKCNKGKIKQVHFFVTEHGETSTERIHIHGILWGDVEKAMEKWSAGFADIGEMRDSTIPYVVKYMYKQSSEHPDYKSIVLTTPGIGKCYVEQAKRCGINTFKAGKENYVYILPNGRKIALCEYYMKKLLTDGQREHRRKLLWKKGKRWVRGLEYDIQNNNRAYVIKIQQEQERQPAYMRPKVKKNDYIAGEFKIQCYEKISCSHSAHSGGGGIRSPENHQNSRSMET